MRLVGGRAQNVPGPKPALCQYPHKLAPAFWDPVLSPCLCFSLCLKSGRCVCGSRFLTFGSCSPGPREPVSSKVHLEGRSIRKKKHCQICRVMDAPLCLEHLLGQSRIQWAWADLGRAGFTSLHLCLLQGGRQCFHFPCDPACPCFSPRKW